MYSLDDIYNLLFTMYTFQRNVATCVAIYFIYINIKKLFKGLS